MCSWSHTPTVIERGKGIHKGMNNRLPGATLKPGYYKKRGREEKGEEKCLTRSGFLKMAFTGTFG